MQLSPLAVLERGYSIVQTADGAILRDASNTAAKANLSVRLHKGSLQVKVTKVQ